MAKQALSRINSVLRRISAVCEAAKTQNDPRGYFAAMYLEVTARIRQRVAEDTCILPDLLATVDEAFAERYLFSLENENTSAPVYPLWDQVFSFNRLSWPSISQHLMASCIVHIGFDLGVAVHHTVRREDMDDFRPDFEGLNTIMVETFKEVNSDLKKISKLYFALSFPFDAIINKFVDFTIVAERDHAWNFALALSNATSEAEKQEIIRRRREECFGLLLEFTRPTALLRLPYAALSWLVKETETGTVGDHIQTLLDSSVRVSAAEISTLATAVPYIGKKRVAVLGGGIASLSAVFHLTSDPEVAKQLDITVYQLGWRLGGKGATGRNPQYGHRIEEHGLHMWFGFYDNAFAMMHRVFFELQRPETYPVHDFSTAFQAIDHYTFAQRFQNEWHLWHIYWPPNDRTPGDGTALELGDALVSAIHFLRELFFGDYDFGKKSESIRKPYDKAPAGFSDTLFDWLESSFTLSDRSFKPSPEISQKIVAVLQGCLKALRLLLGESVNTSLNAYRIWIMADCFTAIICGILRERLFEVGFASINHLDWQDWLRNQGISDLTFESCLVQVGYDSSFAFFRGEFDMEAGTMLDGALRMFFGYKGSIVYRFHAGTGESIVEPLYDCLKKRGVKFEFFHKIKEIHAEKTLSGNKIDFVTIEQQATPLGDYEPFVEVKGMRCWPAQPKFELLKEGKALQAGKHNLESHWCQWKAPRTFKIAAGKDFDEVVCGISIQGLHDLTPTLSELNPRWATMLDKVKTTRTQAFQLWMKPSLEECGWEGNTAILSCNGEPLDSYADLSCVLPFEDWQGGPEPKSVGYFCGAMIDEPDQIPPPTDANYPIQEAQKVKEMALDYIRTKLEPSWPQAFQAGTFRWELLVGPRPDMKGEECFESQFWKANIDPSERYVLSVVDSTRFRLRADDSGFANLFIAGDWTYNGVVDAGCMEAAVLSGKQAANAMLQKFGFEARSGSGADVASQQTKDMADAS